MTILIYNIPLFIAVFHFLGPRFGLKSVYGAVLLGILTDVFGVITTPITADPLLAAIYGGSIGGVGIGLAMRYRGSTGGTDLAPFGESLYRHACRAIFAYGRYRNYPFGGDRFRP